jgi:hypothetical protein
VIDDRLSANGIVLFPDGQPPVVLCALDWAELSNGDYNLWRARLAEAAGTTPDRVAVHCTHCHDAPWPDRDAQAILDAEGRRDVIMWRAWADEIVAAVAAAVATSCASAEMVTEIRAGKARVHEVASNRRVMGEDGKVKGVRWTRCRDAGLRDAPEGLIDPFLKTVSFHQGERKLASLHFYAVHPTSHDGEGRVTCEFVGIARDRLSAMEGVPHIYFTECAGNITTGKYNDGEGDYRERFVGRIFEAMTEAGAASKPCPMGPVEWRVEPVILPPRDDQRPGPLMEIIRKPDTNSKTASRLSFMVAYQQRCAAGIPIEVTSLHLGPEIVTLHTPGEAFIEYQMFAQQLRPEATVLAPSYGDCGPGYVTLERSFSEGGYEPNDSFCSGGSEAILRQAISRLLVGRDR